MNKKSALKHIFFNFRKPKHKRNRMKMERNKTENERGTFKNELKFLIHD